MPTDEDDAISELREALRERDPPAEHNRRRDDGERWDLRRILDRAPKGLVVFVALTFMGSTMGTLQLIAGQFHRDDDRRDVAIAEQAKWQREMDTEFKPQFREGMARVSFFLSKLEVVDKRQQDFLEEAYRQYKAQALERGDSASVKRLTAAIGAIERRKAATAALDAKDAAESGQP